MWIASPDSFVSIVQVHGDRQHLLVRARLRRHLERFLPISFQDRIEEDRDGVKDYRFRARVSREELKLIMTDHIQDIDYTNFKDEAHRRDEELAEMYTDWWVGHYEMQENHHPRGRRRNR